MRVHSNIALAPDRRVTKKWDNAGTAVGTAKAVGKSAPTLLNQAHGISGQNGMVSFILSDGGTQNITIYEFNRRLADMNSGNGWVKMGNNVDYNTQSIDQLSVASLECSESVPFCLVAATNAVTDLIVTGQPVDSSNPNTDKTNT